MSNEKLTPWSAFLFGAWVGITSPFHLLSLRKYRKGERYVIEAVYGDLPVEIREDFTRWNSVLWRWKLWNKTMWMRRTIDMPKEG